MPLVNMNKMLADAAKGGYAVGNFDVFNLEMLKGVMAAVEEMRAPVIIAWGEGFTDYVELEAFAPMVRRFLERASVPAVLHLDHAAGFDTILRAVHAGFTSVMIDASDKPLEENIAMTRKVVEACRVFDVSVESEIGHVSGLDMFEDDTPIYTNVAEAKYFVEQTGVDALAVAIGTVHGVYKEEPKLSFERLAELHAALPVPLVLHGASGLSAEDVKKSVAGGITKVNIFTDLTLQSVAAARRALEKPETGLMAMCSEISEATRKEAIEKIKQLGCAGKA